MRNAAHGAVQKRLRKLEEYSEYSSKSIFLSISSTKSMGLFRSYFAPLCAQTIAWHVKYVYLKNKVASG